MAWYASQNQIPLPQGAQQLINLPPYTVNTQDLEINKITSNNKYRQFLTHNADLLSEVHQHTACGQCCICPATYGEKKDKTTVKYIFNSPGDITHPFQQSDLKSSFLLKNQIENVEEEL